MSANQADMLVEDLCCLLERQISLAIQGDLSGVEKLMFETESLIQELVKSRDADLCSFAEKKKKLEAMYKKLNLIIAGNKNETFAELTKTRKNKTLFKAYKEGVC